MNQRRPSSLKRKAQRLHLRPYPQPVKTIVTWQSVGAVVGFASALVALLLGMLFSIVVLLAGGRAAAPIFHRFGTILLVLVIPLLIFAAHCLDLAEKKSQTTSTTPTRKGRHNL